MGIHKCQNSYKNLAVFPQVNDSIDGLLRQVSQLKGQTSPRLRKLSVSKMFNQLMNRTSSGGSHQEHRAVMPRVSIRDRARKRGHIRQSWGEGRRRRAGLEGYGKWTRCCGGESRTAWSAAGGEVKLFVVSVTCHLICLYGWLDLTMARGKGRGERLHWTTGSSVQHF